MFDLIIFQKISYQIMAIFDLSFSAIPDLHKQAEDIDFFHEEYRK